MYLINNIALSSFGITPTPYPGQSLAVKGVFDFPARKGKSEHNWGTETEAFVSIDDLEYDSRDIIFLGLMKGSTHNDLLNSLGEFTELCKSGILNFETPVGVFQVYMTGPISVTKQSDLIFEIEAKFKQFNLTFPIAPGIASGGTGYLFEGFNLKTDFGIIVNSSTGRFDIPERIEVNTTGIYPETAYRQPKPITLNCLMMGSSLLNLTNQMNRFHGLISTPGLKSLVFPEGASYSVFLKDGFKVSNIIAGSKSVAQFTLILRQP